MKKKEIYVKDIRQGNKIADTFLAAGKSMAFSQKGTPYLTVRLKDKTGEMESKVWDNATELDRVFKKGDIIYIEGRAGSYKNAVQLSIVNIEKCPPEEADPADYLPVVNADVDTMFDEIMTYVEKMKNRHLQELLKAFFRDEKNVDLFKRAPAAKGFHHIYLGGLLEHTLSVVRLLDKIAEHYPSLNKDMLIAGGILHDIGKIYEFSYDNLIDYSDEGRLIGHIVMGVEMINKTIAALPDFPEQLSLELRHLLLSHHGEYEFGSPKRPKTMEALVVHYIDDLDAKLNAFETFMADSIDKESGWTTFNRFFERFLYKGK
ncbi:MAG TPA: HD domain-containing protein [Deltaproteobacteria bacterium]|nr:HD domain-containing protein [Deltaproteobacteria bacterium]